MPTTPGQSWPYPQLTDPATSADIQTLAEAMDTSLTRVHTRIQGVFHRPTISLIRSTGSITATAGTPTTVTFDTVEVDTAGTTNLPTVNDRIIVPAYPCVVRVDASITRGLASGLNAYEIGIERGLSSLVLLRKLPSGVSRTRIAGLVNCTASDPLRLRITALGNTGGSLTIGATTRLTATVICPTG